MEKLNIDLNVLEETLVNFLREEVGKVGFNKVVLGLSGGIDSALVAFLAAKAFGPENVLGIMMPYKTSSKESVEHAELVVKASGIRSKKIEITPMVDAYFALDPDMNSLRKGNKMARERMSILFDHSAKEKSLVLGTSNKTEIMLGYSTQFGDSASAVNPIGDLYKIIQEGFLKDTVEKIIKKIKLSQYKRKLPTIAKVSKRTMGMEFRYPRDWGV